jgi:hypothetical protein
MPKVYWVGLLYVVRKACVYYQRWQAYLPADMPPDVKAAYPYIEAACAALIAYDKSHARGRGTEEAA